ncbi:MAG TPA: nitroreductase family protein [Actinomycetota bacterium]|nr:nitroreductase family protein [Actinomycetota bacterium]
MELREVVRRRRMVRRFDPSPLPAEVLERILHSATRAPSAGFSQGLDLVVLEGPEAVRGFWRATTDPRFGKPYSTAEPPVIVLVLSDPQAYLDRYGEPDKAGLGMDSEAGWPVPYWDMDAAMAVMLMLLTAVDEGVGAWWFGVFSGAEALLRDLGVPEGRRLVGAVALGRPAAGDRPSGSAVSRPRRSLDEVVHRGRW